MQLHAVALALLGCAPCGLGPVWSIPPLRYCMQGAAATPAKKGKGSPGGGYERKELQLNIVDCSSKARPSLGTATLNLADLASADRLQQSVAVAVGKRIAAEAGGTPKLLITIRCGEAGGGWGSKYMSK